MYTGILPVSVYITMQLVSRGYCSVIAPLPPQ